MNDTDDLRGHERSASEFSRRDFVALSLAAGLGAAARWASGSEQPVIETDVEVKTPDGTCDAAFFHPTAGSHPGVLLWPDSNGLRPAFRELGGRLAAEGYSVLVPNHLYRMAKAPVFDPSFNPLKNPDDREKYRRILAPFLAPGAAERDASPTSPSWTRNRRSAGRGGWEPTATAWAAHMPSRPLRHCPIASAPPLRSMVASW